MSFDLALHRTESSVENPDLGKILVEMCMRYRIEPFLATDENISSLMGGLGDFLGEEQAALLKASANIEFASFGFNSSSADVLEEFYSELVQFCKQYKFEIYNPQLEEYIELEDPGVSPPGWEV